MNYEKSDPVEVYKNNRKNCWSIRDNKTGRVINHTSGAMGLRNVTLVVQPAGRERVLREHRKNVHAFVKGEIRNDGKKIADEIASFKEVVYNPYKHTTFIEKVSGKPIHHAKKVLLTDSGKVYVEKYT